MQRKGKAKRRGNFRRVKAAERRRRREHVLDVRMPPSRKEEQRLRLGRWRRGIKIALSVAMLTALAIGGRHAVARHFFGNGDFLVREPVIKTNGSLTHEEILRKAGVADGTHVYLVDLKAARSRIESLPGVRQARVERLLPGRLVISVEERVPAAWLACEAPAVQAFTSDPGQGGCLLDENGVIFPCDELKPALMKLPVVHVRRLPSVQSGVRIDSGSVQSALDLLRCSREALAGRAVEVVEIEAPNDWSLVAKFSDDSAVTFALEDAAAQWQRLLLIMRLADEEGRRLATVNLLPRRNVPVIFFGESPAASPVAAEHADSTINLNPRGSRNTPPAGHRRLGTDPQTEPLPNASADDRDATLDEILGGGN